MGQTQSGEQHERSHDAQRKLQQGPLTLADMLAQTERLSWIDLGYIESPPARNSQGWCSHGSELFIYGGRSPEGRLNDLWSFDCERRKWTCLEPNDAPGGPLIRSGCLLVHDGDHSLYVGFGYERIPLAHNNMYRYDLFERTWSGPLLCNGVPPPPRINFRAWFWGGYVWLFGGSSNGTDCFGDLWRFDTRTNTWSEPVTNGPAPPPCQWCVAERWGPSSVVLFGGHNEEGTPARVFHLFDCETLEWTSLIDKGPPKPLPIEGSGSRPTYITRDQYVFEPDDEGDENAQNDNNNNNDHNNHDEEDQGNRAAALHHPIRHNDEMEDDEQLRDASEEHGQSGGEGEDDEEDEEEEEGPAELTWETLLCSSPASVMFGDCLVLWGGWTGLEHRDEMWCVHIPTLLWNRVIVKETNAPVPLARGSSSAAIFNSTLFLFGGWNGWSQTNDVNAVSFMFPSLQRLCLSVIAANQSLYSEFDPSRFIDVLGST